jgi:hypothetical protein
MVRREVRGPRRLESDSTPADQPHLSAALDALAPRFRTAVVAAAEAYERAGVRAGPHRRPRRGRVRAPPDDSGHRLPRRGRGVGLARGRDQPPRRLLALVAPFAWLAFGRVPDAQAEADRAQGHSVGKHGAPMKYRPRPDDGPPPEVTVPRHPYRS